MPLVYFLFPSDHLLKSKLDEYSSREELAYRGEIKTLKINIHKSNTKYIGHKAWGER